MTYSLHIKMLNKQHAYPEDPNAEYEAWGRMIIFCQSDKIASVLADTEWDLALFSEWFVTNREALRSENLDPPENTLDQPGKSLVETVVILSQREFDLEFDPDEDEQESDWFDYLYQYDTRHNLRKSLMGSGIPPIHIGRHNGHGEISLYGEDEKWHYRFEMEDFIREAEQEIEKFLTYQKTNMKLEKQGARIDAILQQL